MDTKFFKILALITLLLTGVLIAGWQHAQGLKTEIAQLNRDAEGARQLAVADAEKIRELKERNAALQSESEQLRSKLATNDPTAIEQPAGSEAEAATAKSVSETGPKKGKQRGMMKGVAKMFTDPEMKKAMRSQQGMMVKMMYADLATELGLSRDEANQVHELLADRQMDAAAKGMEMFSDKDAAVDPKKLEEIGKGTAAAKAEYDKQLEALLGKERFTKLQEYEKTLGDRMMLNQMQQQFTASGTPLEANQTKGLLDIVKEERLKTKATPFDPTNADPAAQIKALQSEESLDTFFTSQTDLNQRVLERARTILTPDQMLTFEAAQKQQIEMQQMGLKMSREMMKDEQ